MNTNVGYLLMKKGTDFYQWGKVGIGSLLGGIAISLLVGFMLLVTSLTGYTAAGGAALMLVILFGFCGSVMLLGGMILTPLYFIGLHYMGLGQLNQYNETLCQNLNNRSEYVANDLPDL